MSELDQGLRPATFVLLLLIVVILLVQGWYERSQLNSQRVVLDAQWEQQEAQVEQSSRLRQQLESIAGATALLAEQGNENAILIRDQLRKQGVTIRPPSTK